MLYCRSIATAGDRQVARRGAKKAPILGWVPKKEPEAPDVARRKRDLALDDELRHVSHVSGDVTEATLDIVI
ncbi:hypothetical protein GCM10008094_05820 [Aidingimonas halophila]|nr:hypothetical protein GCM10008094_05820 [Aidingimonas halophila]